MWNARLSSIASSTKNHRKRRLDMQQQAREKIDKKMKIEPNTGEISDKDTLIKLLIYKNYYFII
jgi:hypothetical protein